MLPMNEQTTDAHDREKALDPGQSFIVDAPAGSGKTTLLTQRFLRLLSITEQPESIVAITFTRKAAEEMRGRILEALRLARDNPDELNPVTRRWAQAALVTSNEKNWRLLDDPRRLRIQTIDSLCAMLARRGPLLSGYTGDAEVRDNATQLYQQAAHATVGVLAQRGAWSDAVQILLRHLDNDWLRLEELLVDMLAKRDQWLRIVIQDPDREMFEMALEMAVTDELADLERILPTAIRNDLIHLGRAVGAYLSSEAPEDPNTILAELSIIPSAASDDLPLWKAFARLFLTNDDEIRKRVTKSQGLPTKGPGAAENKALFMTLAAQIAATPELVAALSKIRLAPTPSYSNTQWSSVQALFRVLKLAAAELRVTFRRSGVVDFSEVSHAALAALGNGNEPSDLGLLLDYQIQHLLIDEFQDTSITQYELIERLLDGWSEGDGRSLFLVGDPMQSIYRFRQAEVGLFLETRNSARLASIPLTVLQLTTNFRTQKNLVTWINNTIATMRDDDACQFGAIPQLVAARDATNRDPTCVHGFVASDSSAEADAVVDIVKRHKSDDPNSSIGILVRGRRHLGQISDALSAAGIAVSATEIERLGDQTIVQDLLALTRALLHRGDRTAWLGVLRAPWCGMSVRALTVLFEQDRTGTIWQQINHETCISQLSVEERILLENFKIKIAPSFAVAGREPISATLERAWLALCGPAAYAKSDHTHAYRYLELLQTCERRETFVTATRLTEMLERQYVSPPAHNESGVAIMTIHRAKGLEFDVVILPGLGRSARAEQHSLLAWRAHNSSDGRRLLFAPIPPVGGSGDAIHAYLHDAEKNDLADESYRLLYVALTRARESLHLLGTIKEKAQAEPPVPAARSFLRMLWNAVDMGSAFTAIDPPLDNFVSPSLLPEQTVTRPILDGMPVAPEADGVSLTVESLGDVEFEWASPVAKHIGTVTHAIMQRLCREDDETFDAEQIQAFAPYIDGRLRSLGVSIRELADARQRIIDASVSAITSDRGQWILNPNHVSAESEYALSSVENGRPSNVVIDRTFIDTTGIRWIIDFKTGSHTGGAIEAFLDSEVVRYRGQLERYATFISSREDNPIMLGLYFPLLDAWREWPYAIDENGASPER